MEEPSAGLVWRDWILASCLSAVIGVGSASVAGVVLFSLFEDHWFRYVGSGVAFTLILSIVIGPLQFRVLRAPLPFLHRPQWIFATVLGSIVTWAAVFLTPFAEDMLVDDASEWWLTPEASVALGAGLGLGLGLAQSLALREWVAGPWKWVAGNTIAWALATPILWFIAETLASENLLAAFPEAAALLLVAGVVVGLVEGWVVGRFGRRDHAAEAYTHSALGEIGSIDLSD